MARPTRNPGNLPAGVTSFIGRRREVAEIRKRLAAARLVSLVGPGGVGKTRLSIRVAADAALTGRLRSARFAAAAGPKDLSGCDLGLFLNGPQVVPCYGLMTEC